MTRRKSDLSAAEFNELLAFGGFAEVRRGQFVDLRDPARPRPLANAITANRRIDRRRTLGSLILARAEREKRQAAAEAEQAKRERIASTIAPRALPPPRGSLEGAAAIAALADDFITITTAREGATFPDLMRLGWRRAQLIEHADAARSLAYARQGGNAA